MKTGGIYAVEDSARITGKVVAVSNLFCIRGGVGSGGGGGGGVFWEG